MNNVMTIQGMPAVITYDPEIALLRGEFLGLNGGADFYASDLVTLEREGERSLQVFLDACQRRGIEPRKNFSGKFVLRLNAEIHEAAAIAAAAQGKSLNQWAVETISANCGVRS